ncbi:hypothetical protein OHA77_16205 [Streptosporangium sp. NBC_01639]|uniref:hypothetical protein n=1 Tax=Streptosporangium sp. NBC_01639 TaxID=2975948 RepID=UPI00386750E7|nr:hypothetical protein OHA77_16205 [Streptosporangium sp. NBC_01639]
MPVPHDPAHRARLSYVWQNEHWHLLEDPEPTVVLVSDSVSRGAPYVTLKQADSAFWRAVTDSIFTHGDRILTAAWDGSEVALLIDRSTGLLHLAYRTPQDAAARTYTDDVKARRDWEISVRGMLATRYPGWVVWRSDHGRWFATRPPLSRAEEDAGSARTVYADAPEDLAACLKDQAERARKVTP